jgi:hypothetical protein
VSIKAERPFFSPSLTKTVVTWLEPAALVLILVLVLVLIGLERLGTNRLVMEKPSSSCGCAGAPASSIKVGKMSKLATTFSGASVYGRAGKRVETREGCYWTACILDFKPAPSTVNSVTTLMTSRMLDFNPSNINHELCHHTDDATYVGLHPKTK